MGRRKAFLHAAIALAVATAVVSGIAEASRAQKVPAKLTGHWTRTVTSADWKRAGVPNGFPDEFTGPAAMIVSADGQVLLNDFYPRFSHVSGNRLTISGVPDCAASKGRYSWKVAGGQLTLTKLHDACEPEVAVFAGVWTRR